jgi:hypothetical protein
LSSIPFVHPGKNVKRKGKRKDKDNGKSPIKEIEKKDKQNGDENKEQITVIKDYSEEDVRLWKSMSVLETSEITDRPRDTLPLVPVPSPKKKSSIKPQHTERGFKRPDDWVEFDHPVKRSPKKITYRRKDEVVDPSIETPQMHRTSSKCVKSKKGVSTGKTPIKESQTTSHSAKEADNQSGKVEPSTKSISHPKIPKQKEINLSIHFHDGSLVAGQFRTGEKVEQVINDLNQDLLRNDMPLPGFDLYIKSGEAREAAAGKMLLDPTMTLKELDLGPSAHVFVQWKKPMAVTMTPGWFLVDDASGHRS